MKKLIVFFSIICALALIYSPTVLAHVTVKPSEVKIGAYQNFTVSVPTEKDLPTTQVRLVIPEGLESVRPNVKPGWEIALERQGTGDEARVTEIRWTKGSIPTDQRDEFIFSAKTPAEETTLDWKAYQTYQDGSVVSWDEDPKIESEDFSQKGPYSATKVVNDLTPTQVNTVTALSTTPDNSVEYVAYAAIIMATISLALQLRNFRK